MERFFVFSGGYIVQLWQCAYYFFGGASSMLGNRNEY